MSPQEPRRYGGRNFEPPDVPWKQIAWVGSILVVLLVLGLLLYKSYYTVEPHEQAVILRFGGFHTITGPGLHFMIPLVDKVVKVNAQEKSFDLPIQRARRETRGRTRVPQPSTSSGDEDLMLTGDLNAALVEWTLQWQVFEPDKYLFSIAEGHIEDTIKAVAQSVMHRLVGDYSIDEMLTAKRGEVALEAERSTQRVLGEYDCGIRITGLQMQRVTPPARVKPAFDQVNASIQTKEKAVNEANRERNKLIPEAKAKKDALIQSAKGYADRRRAEATGEISALLAKYRAYKESPEVTRRRLYLEAMEEVLGASGPKTILDADIKGLLPLLDLSGTGASQRGVR